MPTYEFRCPEGHDTEHFCSISAKPERLACPHVSAEGGEPCGQPAKQVFLTAPEYWIPGVNKQTVMDYPGSKRLKAGYVHGYVDPGVKKVSVGAGGALNPSTAPVHPLAGQVRPEWKKPAG